MPNSPNTDTNDEDIYNDTVIENSYSLISAIDPLQDKILLIEGVDMENEGVDTGGGVTINADALPPEKKITYVILPTSTTMMKEPIGSPWSGST